MSRFKNALNARDAHIWTLRGTCVLLILVCLVLALGWMNAPRNLTIHQPPDLRSGSTRPLVGSAAQHGIRVWLLRISAAEQLAEGW